MNYNILELQTKGESGATEVMQRRNSANVNDRREDGLLGCKDRKKTADIKQLKVTEYAESEEPAQLVSVKWRRHSKEDGKTETSEFFLTN